MDGTGPRDRTNDLATLLLEHVVGALEARPDLTARLAKLLLPGAPVTTVIAAEPPFMTVKDYAKHATLSERLIRSYIADGMVEGREYRREGKSGRKIVMLVRAADEWRAARRVVKSTAASEEAFIVDEVARRRAVVALKKAGRR